MLLRKSLSVALVMFFILGAALSTPQPAQAAPPMQTVETRTYTSTPGLVITDAFNPNPGVDPIQTFPVFDTLQVADMGTIQNVNVSVNITHNNVGDLELRLEHGGTTVPLVLSPSDGGGNESDCNDLNVTFDDTGGAFPSCSGDASSFPAGTYAPAPGTLASFNALEIQGPWVLHLVDIYPNPGVPDPGTLVEWSIEVTFEVTAIVNVGGEDGAPFFFTDGRENKYDIWATGAIYCEPYGVDVYAIDEDGHGTLAFSASSAEINALGIPADGSTPDQMLIKEGMGFRLYRLPDGQMQVNGPANGDPNGYVFTWAACGL